MPWRWRRRLSTKTKTSPLLLLLAAIANAKTAPSVAASHRADPIAQWTPWTTTSFLSLPLLLLLVLMLLLILLPNNDEGSLRNIGKITPCLLLPLRLSFGSPSHRWSVIILERRRRRQSIAMLALVALWQQIPCPIPNSSTNKPHIAPVVPPRHRCQFRQLEDRSLVRARKPPTLI